MSSSGGFEGTEEAARTLGVTVQHIRSLADSGELTRIARGLIDRTALDRNLTERQGGRDRDRSSGQGAVFDDLVHVLFGPAL